MTAHAKKEKPKPAGVTFAALGPIDVNIEIPGVTDPVTGDPAVITFVCERMTAGLETEIAAEIEDVKAREGSMIESLLATLTLVIADLRGLSDFPVRRDGETRDAFRTRFLTHMQAAGEAADMLVGAAVEGYMERVKPRATFRSFPR